MIPHNHYSSHHILLQPNVIARLMGMDDVAAAIPSPPPPADAAAVIVPAAKPQQQVRLRHRGREGFHFGTGDTGSASSTTCSLHRMRRVLLVLPGRLLRSRPQRQRRLHHHHHHPQEELELLRKMRHDLQQAEAKADGSCCGVVQAQAMAQEKLRREKMARYGFVVGGDDGGASGRDHGGGGGGTAGGAVHVRHDKDKLQLQPIVLLKPSTTSSAAILTDGSVFRRLLPKLMDAGDTTSSLLKEVKERVRRQLKVNAAAAAEAEPTTPQITNREKEDAHHRHGNHNSRRLLRSESFRALRSHRNDHHHASPDDQAQHGSSSAAASSSAPPLSESSSDSGGGDIIIGQISFRSDDVDGCLLVKSSASPRPLLRRSLSAPESLGELHLHPHHQVSPPEVVGCSRRHFFSDLHHCAAFFPTPEPSPKSCVSESEAPAHGNRTDIAAETACDDQDKDYDKDDEEGSAKASDREDSMARPSRPICDSVFEDMYYYYRGDYCGGGVSETATDHRMLFDLANEALQRLVERSSSDPASSSSLCQWAVLLGSSTAGAGAGAGAGASSRGKELEDDVWQQVQALRKPRVQETQTIDSMVAHQVRKSVWTVVLHQDVYAVGRKIERAIFDELVQDLLQGCFFSP